MRYYSVEDKKYRGVYYALNSITSSPCVASAECEKERLFTGLLYLGARSAGCRVINFETRRESVRLVCTVVRTTYTVYNYTIQRVHFACVELFYIRTK